INLKGIRADLPSVTKKDIGDLKVGAQYGMDYVAQSFVRRKEDIRQMRKVLEQLGSGAMVIAKIEDQEGINNMDEIINESDGVMVARGDLGVEIPIEEIPLVQKTMVDKCIAAGKPVIVATQLLESMIVNPRPTRAEVTDVANAIFQKADCIMLSGETTKGEYPVECVSTMHVIAKNIQKKLGFDAGYLKTKDVMKAVTFGACINAEYLDAKAIIVFSKTGKLLSMVSRRRPNVDIFVFTDSDEVKRELMAYWGAFPFTMNFSDNYELMTKNAVDLLKSKKFLVKGDRILIVSDVNPRKNIEILEIREV
ncbi:MAG: pyruvate kinase, partial [Nanoarchaeota archaeon]